MSIKTLSPVLLPLRFLHFGLVDLVVMSGPSPRTPENGVRRASLVEPRCISREKYGSQVSITRDNME